MNDGVAVPDNCQPSEYTSESEKRVAYNSVSRHDVRLGLGFVNEDSRP